MPGPIASLVRPGRDLRVDFLRGLALWFIFIDHTPGNLLGQGTLRNVAFCDATEGFVLLAGYASGIAYGRLLEREGWLAAAAKVAGRAGTLYVAHIFLFVVFTAQVGYSAALLDQAAYLDELALDPFGQEPYRALLEALLLRYQPAFLDILPLYIVVLALFALALPLVNRALALLAVAGLLATAVLLNAVWHGPARGWEPPEWLAAWMAGVDKTGLHPARLLSVLVMTWLLAHLLPAGARFLAGRWASPFVLMGQQSLPVFCAGIFLSFLGRIALEVSAAPWSQAAVNAAGLAALVLVGAVSAWYSGEGGRRRAAPLPAPAGAARP